MITHFDTIKERAVKRQGSLGALEARLSRPKRPAAISKISDDRWLSEMTRCIFQAGFNWKVVDSMWDGFEAAFEGFDPHRWTMMSLDDLDRLVNDKRIVRFGAKIKAVQNNAQFIVDLSNEHGSVGKYFANHPTTEFASLLLTLKKRGTRLGGQTSQYFLRNMGVDGYILSKDVVAALIDAKVIDKAPTSQKAMQSVQTAFNEWGEQSGLTLTEMSRVLAVSIGENNALQ